MYDSAHSVTVRVGTRSRGFIWFFSFLAWFSQHKAAKTPLILLLDEPGLFLHASAQSDLLRYIETELEENHQVVYTTHSPFMIDPKHFERVRMVRDRSLEVDTPLPENEEGTKVLEDPLEVDEGTLFPLQGALAYDITQTLFVGSNSLIIEGASDLLYIPALSSILEQARREGLANDWTLTPVGGIDRVSPFVALFAAQKKLNIATLTDLQKRDQQKLYNLYKQKLLEKSHVLTFAQFTGTNEADIEDMFEPQFYVDVVNQEYAKDLQAPLKVDSLPQHPRILVRIEKHLEANPLRNGVQFNHYRPARFFTENLAKLTPPISAATLDRFEAMFKALNSLL